MIERARHAAVFDVDRTLHDSDLFIKSAFEFALRTHGHNPRSIERIDQLMGKTLAEIYFILVPDGDNEALKHSHIQFQQEHPELLMAFPDTIPTLARIRSAGVYTAAVTSRTRDSAFDNLTKTGVIYYMDNIVTKGDVEKPKPSPEGILKTLDYLSVKPKNAWMTGDSPEDVEAGKAAHVYTIGFAAGSVSKELQRSRPDAIVNNLSEIIPILANKIARLAD